MQLSCRHEQYIKKLFESKLSKDLQLLAFKK